MNGLMDLLAKDSGAEEPEAQIGTLSAEEGPEGTEDGPSPEFQSASDSALAAISAGDKAGFADALFSCMELVK